MGVFRTGCALITGGGQGIGRAAALLFAADGGTVVIVDINEKAGSRTAAEIAGRAGGLCEFLRCDVRAPRGRARG